jgi:glycosyltransferase involved in cell wall biosynthesis
MAGTLEVIIPLRNPTDVLEQTIQSLAAQTDRGFSVLLSDNFSTQGIEFISRAEITLNNSGISVRRIRPPESLERVEHWNWAHLQATGKWLKPLFVGDWLEPAYVASVAAAAAAHPQCRYIFANYSLHRIGQLTQTGDNPILGCYRPATEMRDLVLRLGMQFGPPSVAAYERNAFIGVGGYPTTLPICADSLFFCTLAASFGGLGLPEPLCHFNIHEARFSTSLPEKRRFTLGETFTYSLLLGYHAWTDNFSLPRPGYARFFLRTLRNYWLRGT